MKTILISKLQEVILALGKASLAACGKSDKDAVDRIEGYLILADLGLKECRKILAQNSQEPP